MRSSFRKGAVFVTIAATVLVTLLRVLLMPSMQDADTGIYHVSYIIIGILLVSIIAIFLLVLIGKGTLPYVNKLEKRSCMPIARSAMLFGSVLTVSSVFDTWIWLTMQITPPPNKQVIGILDAIALSLTLLFGILGGLFLIWLGISLSSGKVKHSYILSLSALAPVFWIWFRLVRYEVSYASAIRVSQSFYDFVMLIFTMLFLFSYARYISGTGKRSPRMLLIYSLCTTLLSISGSMTEIILYATRQPVANNYTRLAGLADLGVGIFALCTAIVLAFGRQMLPESDTEESLEEMPENQIISDDNVSSPDKI